MARTPHPSPTGTRASPSGHSVTRTHDSQGPGLFQGNLGRLIQDPLPLITRDPHSELRGPREGHGVGVGAWPPKSRVVPSGSPSSFPSPSLQRGLRSPGLPILFAFAPGSLLQTWPQLCLGLTRRVGSAEGTDPVPAALAPEDQIPATAGQPTHHPQGSDPLALQHPNCHFTPLPLCPITVLSHKALQTHYPTRPDPTPGLLPGPFSDS